MQNDPLCSNRQQLVVINTNNDYSDPSFKNSKRENNSELFDYYFNDIESTLDNNFNSGNNSPPHDSTYSTPPTSSTTTPKSTKRTSSKRLSSKLSTRSPLLKVNHPSSPKTPPSRYSHVFPATYNRSPVLRNFSLMSAIDSASRSSPESELRMERNSPVRRNSNNSPNSGSVNSMNTSFDSPIITPTLDENSLYRKTLKNEKEKLASPPRIIEVLKSFR